MRISIKLTVIIVLLVSSFIILCCTVLLITTANNQIDSAILSGQTELGMLNNAFNAEIDVVGDDELSEIAKRSLILYVFREYANSSIGSSNYVLTDTKEYMFNNSLIDPRLLLTELNKGDLDIDDEDNHIITTLDDRDYLVVGIRNDSLGAKMHFEHEIFLVRDITEVYDGIKLLGIQFAIIALGTIVLSAFVMMIVIRRVMYPLGGLQRSAAALADGQYDNRIQVRGNDEIAELGTIFNKMADAISDHIKAIENTSEERKLLLSALTHELKTPMTSIIGYSESLMRVHLNKSQQDEAIAYINSECKRIERLSQKTMRLITLHGGEPANIKQQSVKELYKAVDMTLQGVAKKEGIELALIEKNSTTFAMDIDMMASVIINLFDNARKANAKHIIIGAEGNKIYVKDDGTGIPSDELSKITQPFYMIDKSHSQSIGGTGLGLALCELIIKAHGAKMLIESQVEKGTSVTISFDKLHFDNMSKNT